MTPVEIIKENSILKDKLLVTTEFQNNMIIYILIDIHLNPKHLIQNYSIQKKNMI